MIIIYEDRDIEKSLPSDLQQLYKHILNCIYQPKLFHNGWITSIRKQIKQIQNEAHRYGTNKVIRILEKYIDTSYKSAVDEFMIALDSEFNSIYTVSDMRKIIPKSYKDIGKNTDYEQFKWDIKSIVNMDSSTLNNFCNLVRDNSESPYDIYR